MNREELHRLCDSEIADRLSPLSELIFVETVLNESECGWTPSMAGIALDASNGFGLFLKDMISSLQMSGLAEKTFTQLWQNEFQDKLWALRKKVSHHAFLRSQRPEKVLNLSRRIIGACGFSQRISEDQLLARLYLMDWFHCTRTGKSLTGMCWFVARDKHHNLVLRSPDWEVIKSHFASKIHSSKVESDSDNQIMISMSDSESKRYLTETLNQSGQDALDIILIKTKVGPAPWKPTFPVKSLIEGHCPDFGWLDLEFLATIFPKSSVLDKSIPVPHSIKPILAA